MRTSYDVMPLSFRLIVFDTALLVKSSLAILIQNGKSVKLEKYRRLSKRGARDRLRASMGIEDVDLCRLTHHIGLSQPDTILLAEPRGGQPN